MIDNIENANIYYHGAGWAGALAAESNLAMDSIHASALSLAPPTPKATGDWPLLWRAWIAAAERGVAVQIYLPSPTQIHPATKGNIGAMRALIAAGISVHMVQGNNLLHAKTCVIDAHSVWIGSGNFTAAAAHHNFEAYLRADCPKIARELITRWESLP